MICLSGNGWGAIPALVSLQQVFSEVEIYSSDSDVLSLKRESDILIDCLMEAKSTYIICAGHKDIIDDESLSRKNYINVHYSLLPKYRGMHSVVWGVLNGEKEFGLTIHLMDKFIDNGPIITQFSFDRKDMNSVQIMEQCNEIVRDNLGYVVNNYIQGKISPIEQNVNDATWVPKRSYSDCIIDFEKNCQQLNLFFDALVSPYPLPMIKIGNSLFEVIDYDIKQRDYFCTEGRVVNIDEEGAWIKIKDGLLIVKKLRLEESYIDPRDILKMGQRLK
ncbi:hypothetical protein L4D76_25995 [Photobacterium sagamiensis]|uniref:formyltransferase family protein n=1 Tax=Photobacterium sagamiensis TaxID=2910241 RepID=UPI003D0E55DA